MQSPLCPVTDSMRRRAAKALTQAGWKGTVPDEPPPPPSTGDERLWAAVLRNDGAAFFEVWRRTAVSLYGFAVRQLPPTAAEAVTIGVYVQLYQQGSDWLGRARNRRGDVLRERLFRTARSMVLREQARMAVQQFGREPNETSTAAGVVPPQIPDRDPDGPLRQLLGRETVERIAAAADNTCQVIEQEVVLMVANGREPAEVTSALGLPPELVHVIKHRALAKLRPALHRPKKRRR